MFVKSAVREGTFRASDKHDSRNSKLYCCHGYHVTEHVLLSTYPNFHLFAFLLKSFSILKVSLSLDKCINEPFKNKERSQYQAWMVNGPFTYTPSGKKRAPSKELVLQWIHKAWQEIPADLVANSFKSCGISNAMDGTEDEAVWEEEGAGADEANDELENEFDTDSEQED